MSRPDCALAVRLEPFTGQFFYAVAVRHVFCGVFFFLPVMLLSEIPKLPTDPSACERISYCMETSLS